MGNVRLEDCGKADKMQVIETVNEDCIHSDCIYRMQFYGSTEFCAYLLVTGEMRGCPISQCSRYRIGDKRVVIDKATLSYRWIIRDDE